MQATVFFKDIRNEIIGNLKKANKEIKVAVAWLTDEDIIRTLTQKKEEGVNVEIVISDSIENFKSTTKFKDYLRNNGKLFISNKSFLHHKFCIIDDKVLINGSYNWSYAARWNEENIIVYLVDNSNEADKSLLSKFTIKHKYFCDKISVLIPDITTLNTFKVNAKDVSISLSQLDEHEIKLRQEFEDAVRASVEESKSLDIPLSPLLLERMVADGGGVDFVKRILHDEITSSVMKSGFRKLEAVFPPRVDLSLEFLVSRPRFETLFTTDEFEFCKKLMEKYKL
jgi:phosphatidylserine/phosphatidylglycerophosphate/cardiolipin synthase-like enzyme